MAIHDQQVEKLTGGEIDALIAAGVPEGKNLEYKRKLPGSTDAEKKEFLADVASFANAAGGLILYGITAEDGIPKQAVGFLKADLDSEILRLEAMVRTGIAERIPGLRIAAIEISDERSLIGIRIPRSWAGPHMVVFKGSSKFFGRDSRGKYQLDLSELRNAFATSAATLDKIRAFRIDRVAAIVARETPVKLLDGPATILHVVPFDTVSATPRLDISAIDPEAINFTALRSGRYDLGRYNFDGLAVTAPFADDGGSTHAYAQLFRNGAIEAVNASMIYPHDDGLYIRSTIIESTIIAGLQQYAQVLIGLGFDPPYAAMLTFAGVKGYRVLPITQNRHWIDFRLPLDRDILLIPEIILDTAEFDAARVLRPIFDTLWQSAGWERSMNYDDSGTHIPSSSPQ